MADRNAKIGGINGGTAGNSNTDYGSFYYWSNSTDYTADLDKSYQACYNFGEDNGSWRLPTNNEMKILSGNNGATTSSNTQRKLQHNNNVWTLHDERPGEENHFVYFPLAGHYSASGYGRENIQGYYWSSARSGNNVHPLVVGEENRTHITNYGLGSNDVGFSVRCLRNVPDPNIAVGGVGINIGDEQNPNWIMVADRNALKGGTNGSETANSPTAYGYYYQWSSEALDASNQDKSYSACFDFGEGNGFWRVPSADEFSEIVGTTSTTTNITDNAFRKIKWDETTWKLFDERENKTTIFTYFPIPGYRKEAPGTTAEVSLDYGGYYWCKEPLNDSKGRYMRILSNGGSGMYYNLYKYGLSVRCIRDL